MLKYKGQTLYVTDVLTAPGMPSLKERMTKPKIVSTKWIFSESTFQSENFGGCPDWDCQITYDHNQANAFINVFPSKNINFTGYVLFSTQVSELYLFNFELAKESPVHFGPMDYNAIYNMSIGYRHDSPTASPYGYTVALAEKSWRTNAVDKKMINGKKKEAVWFVSHCSTDSKREDLVKKLKVGICF